MSDFVMSCYPSYEAMKKLHPKCEHHYWDNVGHGRCKITGKVVNPKTCGLSYKWSEPDSLHSKHKTEEK